MELGVGMDNRHVKSKLDGQQECKSRNWMDNRNRVVEFKSIDLEDLFSSFASEINWFNWFPTLAISLVLLYQTTFPHQNYSSTMHIL